MEKLGRAYDCLSLWVYYFYLHRSLLQASNQAYRPDYAYGACVAFAGRSLAFDRFKLGLDGCAHGVEFHRGKVINPVPPKAKITCSASW